MSFSKEAALAKSSDAPRKSCCEDARRIFVDMLNLVAPLQTRSLHEFMLCSDVSTLQGLMGGCQREAEPRRSFVSAMRNPNQHFGDLKEHEYPDISLSYKLLAEGGQNVNLGDWCNTYVSLRASAVAPESVTEPGGPDLIDSGDAVLRAQAEFAATVPELEFLGVLKHTNRRADHVVRTVYE